MTHCYIGINLFRFHCETALVVSSMDAKWVSKMKEMATFHVCARHLDHFFLCHFVWFFFNKIHFHVDNILHGTIPSVHKILCSNSYTFICLCWHHLSFWYVYSMPKWLIHTLIRGNVQNKFIAQFLPRISNI